MTTLESGGLAALILYPVFQAMLIVKLAIWRLVVQSLEIEWAALKRICLGA